ncbi:MAG: GAF domain-containing protein [Sideroxydans sp.]|nr:GAF domain-containing protein [Sideroxydans sp.]
MDMANTTADLHILILENPSSDAAIMEQVLSKAGMAFVAKRVNTRAAFIEELEDFQPDIILADSRLAGFDGTEILRFVRRDHPEIPVIMVTEALTDLEAINLIQAGAKDYIPKDRLAQLPAAVQRALTRERGIRARKSAEKAQHELLEKLRFFRALIDNSSDAIEVIDPSSLRFLDVNDTACLDLGYSREELLSMSIPDIDPAIKAGSPKLAMVKAEILKSGKASFESTHQRKDGSEFPVEINARQIELDQPYGLNIVRDITQRKKTEAELLRLNRVHRTLSEGNRTMLHARSEQELMENICNVITTSGGYALAWIGLAQHDESKSIDAAAIAGTGKDYVESLRLTWDDRPNGRGPAGTAVRTGQTQISHDIQNDPCMIPWKEKAAQYGYVSSIALPLIENEMTIGVLVIYSSEPEAFSTGEVSLLENVANDLAFGIVALHMRNERDHAIQERQQHAEQLRASLEDTLQAIAATMETRDPYTAGHQHRVAHLALAIAHELGLPEEQIHGIQLAAIVHDIGKIRIPAEILSKPGKLTNIEYRLIRVHPQAGYDILKGIKFPWPIAQAVLQHHERMDGSGYPQGLKGEKILFEARILAVADVIESMSSHRPYRPGLGIEAALEEIEHHRGIRYDPQVVDSCLTLFRERGYHLPA